MARLTQQQLETHLWGAATILRGRTAGQDYKSYILPLIFFKRLSDQWDYEAEAKIGELERERGRVFTDAQRRALLSRDDLHRFKIPKDCHWRDVSAQAENIGEALDRAMHGIAAANKDLTGIFTASWNLPAPDGNGRLIANTVVHALVQHFGDARFNLSNANVSADVIGRAYEYLIKKFADDAGTDAAEFFTPPEVVDLLVRILEPEPHETVYDPTCGSGGMLVHSADFIRERGQDPTMQVRYYGQEMNWATYAIARINMILHGLEADIRGGKSTISDPLHVNSQGGIKQFGVVMANFPFADEKWWLPEDQRAEEQAKKAKKAINKKTDGAWYKDRFGRFAFGTPPASCGDFAFIQHIAASMAGAGRAGVVCPQGVLFRGQAEIEEDTGEFDEAGLAKIRRRKADDEHLIRRGMLDTRLIDAVIALPINIFYGAGLPACLLILNRNRPEDRKDKVLFVYASRHFRELSNKNQLRPQDLMRVLVHYQAYGDGAKAASLVERHSARLRTYIDVEEAEEVGRIRAEYHEHEGRIAVLETEMSSGREALAAAATKTERTKCERALAKAQSTLEKLRSELATRDRRLAESKRQADDERRAVDQVGVELVSMYADPRELEKHARVVESQEIVENEFNLNVALYLDIAEPERLVDVKSVRAELDGLEKQSRAVDVELKQLLEQLDRAEKKLLAGASHAQFRETELGRLPASWTVTTVGDVLLDAQYGLSMKMSDKGRYPILRMAAIQDGDVLLDDLKYVDLPDEIAGTYLLRRGDVLFNRTNSQDLVGKVGVFRSDLPAVFASYLIRVKIDPAKADNYFMGHLLASYAVQCRIRRYATPGVQQVNINASNLRRVKIGLPLGPDGLREQRDIAAILERHQQAIRTLEKKAQALAQVKRALVQRLLRQGLVGFEATARGTVSAPVGDAVASTTP